MCVHRCVRVCVFVCVCVRARVCVCVCVLYVCVCVLMVGHSSLQDSRLPISMAIPG